MPFETVRSELVAGVPVHRGARFAPGKPTEIAGPTLAADVLDAVNRTGALAEATAALVAVTRAMKNFPVRLAGITKRADVAPAMAAHPAGRLVPLAPTAFVQVNQA